MLLEVERLEKSWPGARGPIAVLRDVSFALDAGQSAALTGESGSGKSTVLSLIATLDRPDSGQIRLDGREITGLSDGQAASLRRSEIGLVFQQFNLIPSLTAGQNLSFHARLAKRHDPAWSAQLAARLGLEAHLDKYPEALSGGQQQRVAVGRVLALRPRLVLADEPTGNLDEASGDAVLDLMLSLCAQSGAALVMVTHSERLASKLQQRHHLSGGVLV
ncbi:MAG: ABC transporter ATP-binding protein [Mangrovicoccus sp.]|nr:ABC transporter ATP-binding protein [Mangrovicoccus sp.]